MTRQAAKLVLALELEARAHQLLVNIGAELRTVYCAGEEPDDEEMLRLRQAYEALLAAANAVMSAAHEELVPTSRRLRAPRRPNPWVGSMLNRAGTVDPV